MLRWLVFLCLAGGVHAAGRPLNLLVMDPLALPLSCACVDGVGQRRYDVWAGRLEERLGRSVRVIFDESLTLAKGRTREPIDLVIGKDAMVRFDAEREKVDVRQVAALTDRTGRTELRGVVLARADSSIRDLAGLAGKRVALGPLEEAETNEAARRSLPKDAIFVVAGSIDAAVLMLGDGEVDAAVASDFLPPLFEGCGKLERGSVKVIGKTPPVPFIRLFATDAVDQALEQELVAALARLNADVGLRDPMESRHGFVRNAWHDWRGDERAAMVPRLPNRLPARPLRCWTAPLTGPAVAGVTADDRFVIVPDKSADDERDVFRCLDARDGSERWRLTYDAPGDMEYSNAPRATPVIRDGLVYLQGAFGHLHCVDLATGKIVWKRNLFADFAGEVLNWGASVPPLAIGDRLLVNPGSARASLAMLNRHTGAVIWQTKGHAAAYSAFVTGTFNGIPQLIGYDSAGIGGWNPTTGERLWEVVPRGGADFNVLTPVILGDRLLLGSENNATRLYGFDDGGRLESEPLARNEDLAPDTCTPVVVNGRIFATAYGELFCVRRADMKTLWKRTDDMFYDHSSVIGAPDRLLVWTMAGDLLLLDANADEYREISRFRPFGPSPIDSMSHPAIAGDRIYLRWKHGLTCFSLYESE